MTYEELIKPVLEVKEVFTNFYGEDRVDLQNLPKEENWISNSILSATEIREHIESSLNSLPIIIVYFPEVKVVNEDGNWTIITDLYVRIKIALDGTLRSDFKLIRTSYSESEIARGYLHSHVNHLPGITTGKDDPTEFQPCCLGSGPIKSTMASLGSDYDPDVWRLFCLELDLYLKTESLSGGPYHHLADLTKRYNTGEEIQVDYLRKRIDYPVGNNIKKKKIVNATLAPFINYLIHNYDFKIGYNGSINFGESLITLLLKISNMFIYWMNTEGKSISVTVDNSTCFIKNYLKDYNIVVDAVFTGGKLFYYSSNSNRVERATSLIGRTILNFKGVDKVFTIKSGPTPEGSIIILNPAFFNRIKYLLLMTLNKEYGKKRRDSTIERVCYI